MLVTSTPPTILAIVSREPWDGSWWTARTTHSCTLKPQCRAALTGAPEARESRQTSPTGHFRMSTLPFSTPTTLDSTAAAPTMTALGATRATTIRSEEHTSELQ